ncbi:MAG: putative modulator of gyrase [Bacteroidetes bacterium]|nr:putative modulator of gyrase [Bacteroidota bacterium]
MIKKEQKELARWAMQYALKKGCQECRVGIFSGSESSFEVRDTQLDKLQQAEENQMVLYLFVDGRYGAISTNRMDRRELEKFIADGVTSVRFLAEDPARKLPDPSLYFSGSEASLELYDPKFQSVSADEKLKLAKSAATEIYGSDSRIISVSSAYGDTENFAYIVASNGFEGESATSSFGVSVSVSVKGDGDARPESYWYDESLTWEGLQKQGVGKKALERALRKMGQSKIQSGKYQMLVENMAVRTLLSPLISAINGSSIQQKNSFLLDKIGQKVVADKITLVDNPLLPKALGAKCFDREGIATKKRNVFEHGVLQTYFIDSYIANKLNVEPTTGSPSVLYFDKGNYSQQELIGKMLKGILVTGFNGGNCNSSTGNFSYGIEGFLIENGELKQPISEMNITGDMLTLWSNLAEIGNNPLKSSSWQLPTLLFDSVDFSGL